MKDLEELYQDIVLDHYKNPRNFENFKNEDPERVFENPVCGDSVRIRISLTEENTIQDISIDTKGCIISTASASIMSEYIRGSSIDHVRTIIERFIKIMEEGKAPSDLDAWGEVAALMSVIRYPARIKCVTLPWNALRMVLE